MQIQNQSTRPEGGYALIMTMMFVAICVAVLGSVCTWTSTETGLTERNNLYNSAVAAAEAGTEAAISQMTQDFLHQSLSQKVDTYSDLTPGKFVKGWPGNYSFTDNYGHPNRADIVCNGWQQWTNLASEFKGLYGMVNLYDITSTATVTNGRFPVKASVRQSVQFTAVPVFQFAIFYTMDLEINPAPPMLITGKTHGNADMYLAPSTSLEFVDTVSTVGNIYYNRSPNDPSAGTASKVKPVFDAEHLEHVSSLTMPIGVDNNPSNIVQMLDLPNVGEDPRSPTARQRFYSKSDLIVTVDNSRVTVTYNNNEEGIVFSKITTNALSGGGLSGYSFVNTNVSFYDYRENKQILCTELNIRALTNWLHTAGSTWNTLAQAQMSHQINTIYVDDQRTAAGKLTAVRVANGQYLPDDGLTVSTRLPLYVKGHYNAPDLTPGVTDTSKTRRAALASDAITILSSKWDDAWTSGTKLVGRNAGDTTINAAFLSGIVPTFMDRNGGKHYSGGVENFPRFLENWSSSTMTYNGSMVVMFASRFATNYWVSPGTYYNAPKRNWAFDKNFTDANKLPPATPQARKLQRETWDIVAINTK